MGKENRDNNVEYGGGGEAPYMENSLFYGIAFATDI